MDNPQTGRTVPFQFNGKAGEYFRIWIVNIMLSIITLGIYSPWAKVRTKRYFYGNTTLAGSSFEYLGDPLAILKGRMIVFAFILVYVVSTEYMPALGIVFFILYMIGLPWMVIKSMQFNARNSAYRNICFNFEGRLKEAAFVFIFLSLLSVLTLGLAIPYMIKRFKQFTIENSRFGTAQFEFHATTWSFYKIYLLPMIIPMIGIIAAIAIPAYQAYQTESKALLDQQYEIQQPAEAEIAAEEWADEEEWSAEDQILKNQIETCMQDPDPDQCMEQAMQQEMPQASEAAVFAGMSFALLIYMLMGLIWVYIHTRSTNLVLNSTTLSSHSLQSDLRVFKLFFIYLSNLIAVLVSFGLLIPWARIRLARYRFANTFFIASTDLNDFIAEEQSEVAATGGEFADAFDIDLGF